MLNPVVNRLATWCLSGAVAVLAGAATPAAAARYTILYSFTGGADGGDPARSVVQDAAGNIYGSTFGGSEPGGSNCVQSGGCGTLYKIDPAGHETTLFTFDYANGQWPGALTLVGSTLYGTTETGGAQDGGVVFSLNTDGTGFKLPYQFDEHAVYSPAGAVPTGTLVPGANGALYGTTEISGALGWGTLYRLDTDGTLTALHNFADAADGAYPFSLLKDAAGTLFGSTQAGGRRAGSCGHYGCGVVFEYVPSTALFAVVHAFDYTDGSAPLVGSVSATTLYGATTTGGAYGGGTLFSISAPGGHIVFTDLHDFNAAVEGYAPNAGPTVGPNGKLSGTLTFGPQTGSTSPGYGTLYTFSAGTLKTLYAFDGVNGNAYPYAATTALPNGTLLGTASGGNFSGKPGSCVCGTVFSYTP